MAGGSKLFTLILSILLLSNPIYAKDSQVPCYFVFGDSLADNGNNNKLATRAKVNHPPYGIDFQDGPTGRFSNGRTMIDVVSGLLGFETPIPPFATASGRDMLKGVNYASGAAGILDESGSELGDVVCMNQQLENHQATISQLSSILGGKQEAENHLNKCLYTVIVGHNDFINNYFMPQYYNTSRIYTPDQYAEVLLDKYSHQLRTLYTYGARKLGLFSLGRIGCTPNAISKYGTNGSLCVDNMNNAASAFNQKLKSSIDRLNKDLPDAKFFLLNPELPLEKLSELGLRIFGQECCDLSEIGQCMPNRTPCRDRQLHVFWDGFHPTEIVNVALGKLAYTSIVAHLITL